VIRELRAEDWTMVTTIYEEGIRTGNATFETEVSSWEERDAAHPTHRLVAERDDAVVGWAARSPVSARSWYAGVAENSVYVSARARGQGVGRELLSRLIRGAEADGIWTIQTSIFPENTPSLALHERCGFRRIGTRERIAQPDGVWRDTVLMERRSPEW
jgi:L-amino acid N-acyltransferase YncA